MARDNVEKWQEITGYSRDYDSSQKVLSRRHFGNDKHLTKDDAVRTYEKIRGAVPQTDSSLQEGLYNRLVNDVGNLINNPSFEDNMDPVTDWNSATTVANSYIRTRSTDAAHGNYSMLITNYQTGNWVQTNSNFFPAKPNETFYYDCWVKATGDVSSFHVKFCAYDRDGANIYCAGSLTSFSNPIEWTRLTGYYSFRNSADVSQGLLAVMAGKVSAYAGATTCDNFVDNVIITPLEWYPSMKSEKDWLDTHIALSADTFGQWRATFENDLNSTVDTSTATFTRTACSATQLDSNGKIQITTVANSPRFESSREGSQGVWLERAASNYLSGGNTDTFTTSVSGTMTQGWSYYQNGGTVNATATYNSADSGQPFGSTCQMIAIPATATASWRGISQGGIPGAANSSFTISFYAKRDDSATGNIAIFIDEAGGTNANTSIALNTDWTRHQYTYATNAASAGAQTLYIRTSAGSPGIQGGLTMYLNAIQLEMLPWATTYIPTTSVSSTRNLEALKYNTPTQLNPIKGTMATWFKPLWNGNDSYAHYIIRNVEFAGAGGASGEITIVKDTLNQLDFWIFDSAYTKKSVTASVATNSIVANNWYHMAGTWNNGSMFLYLNGVSIGASGGTGSGIIGALDQYTFIGDAFSNPGGGLYDDVAIYDRALSSAEIWNLYIKGH